VASPRTDTDKNRPEFEASGLMIRWAPGWKPAAHRRYEGGQFGRCWHQARLSRTDRLVRVSNCQFSRWFRLGQHCAVRGVRPTLTRIWRTSFSPCSSWLSPRSCATRRASGDRRESRAQAAMGLSWAVRVGGRPTWRGV